MATSGGLTEEQKRRIEDNRRRALLLRSQRSQVNRPSVPQSAAARKTPSETTSRDYLHSRTIDNTYSSSATNSTSKEPPVSLSNPHVETLKTTDAPPSKSASSNQTTEGSLGGRPELMLNPAPTSKQTITSFYSVKPKPSPQPLGQTGSRPVPAQQMKPGHQAGNIHRDVSKPSRVGAASAQGTVYGSLGSSRNTGTCILVSRDRFTVTAGYNVKLIEMFKEMPSKNYDAVQKKWSFSLSDYDTLIDATKTLQSGLEIEPLPRAILSAFGRRRKGIAVTPVANLTSVDDKLVNAMMGFQREGVNIAISREGRVLIADEMGLGKTLQAICIACYYRAEWPVLVVTPSSIRYSWDEAFRTWVPSLNADDINVVQNSKSDGTCGQVNILSYDLMHRKAQELKQFHFQVVILDESHFMKNSKTARAKAALPLLKAAPRVILLSGTPALSRPCELYTQILAVAPRLFPLFHDFGLRYCNATQNQWGWDYSGSSNMAELQLILEECVMVRRMKQDVMNDLPSKTRQMVIMDPSLVKTNSKALKTAANVMGKNKAKSADRGLLLNYFNETGLVKVPAVRDYVLDLLEAGHKFLVFAHHQCMVDALCDAVSQKKYEYMRIDGSTGAQQRKANCDRFQMDEACRVAILSITAANAGLTLTSASLVVFAELFWNPGILVQAEDRVHRIGQVDSVNIRYLIAGGTADDFIWPLVQRKLAVLETAGLSRDDFSKADTTAFKDPRQKSILSYFEKAFLENDHESEREDLACLVAMESQEDTRNCDRIHNHADGIDVGCGRRGESAGVDYDLGQAYVDGLDSAPVDQRNTPDAKSQTKTPTDPVDVPTHDAGSLLEGGFLRVSDAERRSCSNVTRIQAKPDHESPHTILPEAKTALISVQRANKNPLSNSNETRDGPPSKRQRNSKR